MDASLGNWGVVAVGLPEHHPCIHRCCQGCEQGYSRAEAHCHDLLCSHPDTPVLLPVERCQYNNIKQVAKKASEGPLMDILGYIELKLSLVTLTETHTLALLILRLALPSMTTLSNSFPIHIYKYRYGNRLVGLMVHMAFDKQETCGQLF